MSPMKTVQPTYRNNFCIIAACELACKRNAKCGCQDARQRSILTGFIARLMCSLYAQNISPTHYYETAQNIVIAREAVKSLKRPMDVREVH